MIKRSGLGLILRNKFAAALLAAFVFLPLALPAQSARQPLPDSAGAAYRRAPVGRLPADRTLKLAIALPLRHREELTDLIGRLYDPASPDYHQYLTVRQFTDRFGPTQMDYNAVAAFAEAHHLHVSATHPNRLLLDVEGPVSEVEKTFNTTLRLYRHPTEPRNFFAPDTAPSVDLAIPILHVSGLDDFKKPRALNRKIPSTPQPDGPRSGNATLVQGSGPGGTYLGYDFRAAYMPGVALTGAGQKVGLLEFDSGFSQSDITAYETLSGLPPVPVTAVLLDGYQGGLGPDNDEVSLDIEMAMAMAPQLSGIVVYEGDSTDDILNQMATDTNNFARQLSASWTYGIDAGSDQDFLEFAAQGQSFFNASGDSDAYVGGVDSPCDDTNIIAVGGTTLATDGPGGIWSDELVWNWGGGIGSSGGISDSYAIPFWQKGVSMASNQGSSTMRNTPDVALTADNIYVAYGDGLNGSYGGTSCASPLWAGVAALINQQAAANRTAALGFANPALYAIGLGTNYTNCFHDIIYGNNFSSASPALFPAVPGYDLCTGWGAPTGQPLIDALAPDALGIFPAAGITATGPAGGPFANTFLTLQLTNRSGTNLNWVCVNTAPWLTVSPTNGVLRRGAAATVQITLAKFATNFAAGAYSAYLSFTNLTDGIGQARGNWLLVNPAAPAGTFSSTVLGLAPLGYWPLNESIVPPAADICSNAGVLGIAAQGFPINNVLQGQSGIVSNCFYFSNPSLSAGYLGTYVDVPFNSALNPGGPFTVEFWTKPNQSPNDDFCPISSVDNTENYGDSRCGWLFYETDANQWSFRLGNLNGYAVTLNGGAVQTNVWQHVAGVYDGTNATLYVNGVVAAGPTSAGGFVANTNQAVTLRMGATSFGNRTFDGAIDEAAVFTNALSASAIYGHYRAAATNNAHYGSQLQASRPAGYWHLDEPAYTAVPPSTLPKVYNLGTLSAEADGVYYPGSHPGAAGVRNAGFGSGNLACSFSGSSFIDIPGGPLTFTGAVTLSAWVQALPSLGQFQSVAGLGPELYQLGLDAQGRPNFTAGSKTAASTNTVGDNQWHHLAGIYDGANSVYLYVDGQLAAANLAGGAVPAVSGNDFWIGGDPDAGAYQYFNGVVDEVAVFPAALGSNQIASLFASGYNATHLQPPAFAHGASATTLTWAAAPGQSYTVQSCTNLIQGNWTVIAGPVTATNATMTTQYSATGTQRYYRVVQAP